MKLEVIGRELTVCKLASAAGIDLTRPLWFAARTDEEVSLVCPTEEVPAQALAREDGWRAFRAAGVLDFSLVGILARLTGILAERGIGLFAVSTFNTDYILVRSGRLEEALAALKEAGCTVG